VRWESMVGPMPPASLVRERSRSNAMRNILTLVILGAVGFILVGLYIAPTQPDLRSWYLANACEHLDKLSPKLCQPMRDADGARGI